jgi:hypothetical protein
MPCHLARLDRTCPGPEACQAPSTIPQPQMELNQTAPEPRTEPRQITEWIGKLAEVSGVLDTLYLTRSTTATMPSKNGVDQFSEMRFHSFVLGPSKTLTSQEQPPRSDRLV